MPLTRKLATKSLIKQNTNQDVIGTGVTNLVRDAFTGTGSQTVFTLTTAPLSAANTQVFISGVYQNKNTYTVIGTTLTFSTAPPSSTLIEVISGTNYSIGVPGDGAVTSAKLDTTAINLIMPSGSVIAYAGASAPTGYLLCDGTSYATSAYPTLFASIGYAYGGSGANFNVPDTRGIFLRGAGTQTIGGSTYSATLGTEQNDQTGTHTHNEGTLTANINHNSGQIFGEEVNTPSAYTANLSITVTGVTTSVSQTQGIKVQGATATNNAITSNETRPANVGINYIIKT
jgi:microcystin-dependent protein